LRVLDACQAEVTYLEIAVLVDQDIAGFQVSVHNTGRVHILEAALHP
jgi:hypothetical protein